MGTYVIEQRKYVTGQDSGKTVRVETSHGNKPWKPLRERFQALVREQNIQTDQFGASYQTESFKILPLKSPDELVDRREQHQKGRKQTEVVPQAPGLVDEPYLEDLPGYKPFNMEELIPINPEDILQPDPEPPDDGTFNGYDS